LNGSRTIVPSRSDVIVESSSQVKVRESFDWFRAISTAQFNRNIVVLIKVDLGSRRNRRNILFAWKFRAKPPTLILSKIMLRVSICLFLFVTASLPVVPLR